MRRILCVILTFVICSFSFFHLAYAEEGTSLQDKQQNLQNQINETNQELESVQGELSQNLDQVQKLDEKIQNSQKELKELNQKILGLQNSIEEVEIRLNSAEEKYNKQKILLENRLVAIYESSDTQYLDVILTSKSVSEFLSNYFLITEIATYDTELLTEMKEKKNKIQTTRNKLEQDKNQLAIIKRNQTKTEKVLENTKIVRENYIAKLSEQERELQAKIDDYTAQYNAVNDEISQLALGNIASEYIGGELAWPVPGYTRISSNYGMRLHPILHVYKLHTGVDISAPMGANFIAANDGVVTKAGFNTAYGNMVIVDHGGGISTLYAHGSEILVEIGQTVKRGQAVLKVGSTGYSTGAHAHFEVRLNGTVTNPLPYITNGVIPETLNKNAEEKEELQESNTLDNTAN